VLFALPDPTGVEHLLRAFAIMSTEWERAVLVFEADNPDREQLIRLARELEIADSIRCVTSAERELAVACADVVIAPATDDHCGRSNSAMLMAMACGRAVVAADVPENRECTADGRGCVWFRSGDITDLAHRAVFVARNQDFSRALGENGRTHIQLTRAPQVAARQYDEIYRHAQARRSDNLPRISVPKIYAIDATI
jgi:glycosyltransferase involved in cell wall biosynthesis